MLSSNFGGGGSSGTSDAASEPMWRMIFHQLSPEFICQVFTKFELIYVFCLVIEVNSIEKMINFMLCNNISNVMLYVHFFVTLLKHFILLLKRYEETEEQKPDDAFREVITSCRSLSTYEPNNLKSALPQVKLSKYSFFKFQFENSETTLLLFNFQDFRFFSCRVISHCDWDVSSILSYFSASS